MKFSNFFLFITFSSLLLAACSENKPKTGKWQDTVSSGFIQIAADDSFEPIMNSQVQVFESIYLKAGIMPMYTTEVEALKLLYEDSVRLAIVTRPLSPSEHQAYNAKKRFPREMKIATDAITLIINKSNPDSIISVKTIEKILTGKISKWTEINPESPLAGDINVVFDNKESGTVRFAIDSICKGVPLSTKLYAETKNRDVIDYVSQSPHALGIIGVDWVGDSGDSTRMKFNKDITVMSVSRIDDPNIYNSYKPYQAYIATKQYPLVRDVYAILNDPRGGLSSGFMTFLCSQRGQYIFLKSGLVPATQPVRIVEITK